MLAVIELAQQLTGALDDKFNIINKSAVLHVVTCLEAFSITHDSYREVQNTRIIKDLQALRQNKGNDQILAKRIKNLLRKWKERLAAAAPSTIPQSSQPNSPNSQNMSQGSSDTQFMTQHSQSPPISQIRTVNGPTSFTNLLPKSHNSSMMPTTSPILQVPYQNGCQDVNTKLLGKRKLDGRSNDMDENSNHSRKKVMKKSSPVKPFVFPQNNNSMNHNSTLPTAVPATIQAQVSTSSSLHPISSDDAIPKKRGRKKGSKGIDSMLNGVVPDFQAEIQQKIALSAGKRNKTTIELQQMLESHQNSTLGWTNSDMDSNSQDRGSKSSVNLQHNNFNSNEIFTQSQKLQMQHVKSKKNVEKKDDLSAKRVFDSIEQNSASRTTPIPLTIEEEIIRLRSQLPPIDYEAAATDNFDELNTFNAFGDLVQCTCTFREVITYLDDTQVEENSSLKGDGFANGKNKIPDDSDDETDDFCAVDEVEDIVSVKSPISPPSRGAVKSIFDPEYDANENLIEEMVRRKECNQNKVIEIKVEKDAVKSSKMDSLIMDDVPAVENLERVPIINFECDEDPMCPARAHFQKDPIELADVEKFHNHFVSGVNGFWNGIPLEKTQQDFSNDNEQIDYAKHRLWKRVVPNYDFLTCDRVPKTFNDDSPFALPTLPVKKSDDNEEKKPFNGFSRKSDIEFREWHECINIRSYNDEVLTILPYVIID